jgi:LacI family transcriptional regulator
MSLPIHSAGTVFSRSRRKRLSGVEEVVKRNGSEYELVVKTAEYEKEFSDSAYETEVGYELTKQLFKKHQVTAIIWVNDMLAYGAIRAIGDIGLSVPDDISVCGFDNLYLSHIVNPGITTVDHLISQRCQSAVSLIIGLIEKRNKDIFKIFYEPQLVIRSSTARPKTYF